MMEQGLSRHNRQPWEEPYLESLLECPPCFGSLAGLWIECWIPDPLDIRISMNPDLSSTLSAYEDLIGHPPAEGPEILPSPRPCPRE